MNFVERNSKLKTANRVELQSKNSGHTTESMCETTWNQKKIDKITRTRLSKYRKKYCTKDNDE